MSDKPIQDLAGSGHWIQGYTNIEYKRHNKDDVVYQFIRKYVQESTGNETVIEIGSFPGTYISEFGELGYSINGIDIHPENARSMPAWLGSLSYRVGIFYSEDLFHFRPNVQYDIVCSFGFIEHFINYLEMIDRHDELLKTGGLLVITAPNYRGWIQKLMHKYLSPGDYALHYIPSMNPSKWASHLEEKGYEILFQGYFGGMNFWIGTGELNTLKRFVYNVSMRLLPFIGRFIPFESSIFSKNCGLVARKK